MRRLLTKTPYQLIFPILIYLFLATLYLFAIPVGESPDEPGHFVCLEQVAIHNRLPTIEPKPEGENWWSRGRIIAGHMCYHMPLYYIFSGVLLKTVGNISSSEIHFEFPPSNPNGPNPNMFLHEDKTSFLHFPEPVTILSLRLFSVLQGLIIVILSFFISTRFFPNISIINILSASLVAGWPQFVFLSRGLSNDILATTFALVVLLILLNQGNAKRFSLATIFSSLAILTKITMLFTLIAVFIVWLLEFWPANTRVKRSYLKSIIFCGLIWLGTSLIIYFNPTLSQNLFNSGSAFSTFSENVLRFSYWIDVFHLTLHSGWVRFGWMNVTVPDWHIYFFWTFASFLSIVGIIKIWGESSHKRKLLIIGFIWLSGLLFTYMRINSNRFQPQFRFVFASLPLLCTFIAAGVFKLLDKRPLLQPLVTITIACILISYNCWVLFSTVAITYGWEI